MTEQPRDQEPRRTGEPQGVSVGQGIIVGIVVAIIVIAVLSVIFWAPWAARDGVDVIDQDDDALPPTPVPPATRPYVPPPSALGYVLV